MELRHLRYFIAVAEELSFTRAAARLYIAQPALSQQIQQLEQEMNVRLFNRTKRKVELTGPGEAFLHEARETLAKAADAVDAARRAARGETGKLAVGFIGSAAFGALPQILRAFHEAYPDIAVRLHQMTTIGQLEGLLNGAIDIGFVCMPIDRRYDKRLNCEPVWRDELLLACADNHWAARLTVVALPDLKNESFVMWPRHQSPGFYDHLMSYFRNAGFTPRVIQEIVQQPTIVSMVAAGIGVSVVLGSMQSLRRLGVIFRPLKGSPYVDVGMVWRRDDEQLPSLSRFRDVSSRTVSDRRREERTSSAS